MRNRQYRNKLFIGILLFVAFVSVGYGRVSAQPLGYVAVKDVVAFRERFKKHSANILSIESSFRQEKILSALTEKITATGKFYFKRSDRIRIEYLKPFSYVMVLNGDKMFVRDGQKESQINVRSNKLFQQVNRIMIDCVQGTILESKDFNSRISENDNAFLLELNPVSKALREFFSSITVTVDKKDYSASTLEMNEPSGDKTTIVFIDKKINTNIQDAVFAL
ncbi:MAG TPA: outer membrane lipoprotein carrier protein LolA [Chryseolinea sp.]|nr:outer membrane lipoprotein carrier protein LolA [Chryseolinea sp.]